MTKEFYMADNTPIYNLKAVINEVGLNPATLRAWERRYGLVKPQRTPGGHRLYSRQDIDMLKWLIERQKEGLSISNAVEMWKSQPENYPELSQQIHAPSLVSDMGETMIDELRDAWLAACLVFDDQAANRVLDQAFTIASPETICTEVLQKGLAQIGEGWYIVTVSVQQEHFTSAITVRRINTLLAATATTPPTRSGQLLAACPPGEEHDFILMMITYLLRRRGWDIVYLGANVPLRDLDVTIQSTSPRLIVFAAQTLTSAASLRLMSETIVSYGIPLAYGGGIFNLEPASTQCISGYYLGTEVASVPQMVEHLVTTPLPIPLAQLVTAEYTRALAKFKENEALIASFVTSAMQAKAIEPRHLEVANVNLNQNIASALQLGDINFLDHSIAWLDGLLKNHGYSTVWVRQYYTIYRQAVERYLGQDGVMIQDLFARNIPSA
jgi:DNA-binding transcriptional MerR regulator